MPDISNILIKDSFQYILQCDLSTSVISRIDGDIPIDPKFISGITISSSFKFTNGNENDGYVLTSDSFGNGDWKPISGITSGISGSSGLSGISGSIGVSGISGLVGIIGLSGISGLQGLIGNSGISGLQGLIGNSGISGLQGISGQLGIQGDNGISGLSGQIGNEGNSGISGLQGISGEIGISGLSGTSGEFGTSGISGLSGTLGESGISGIEGLSGLSGIDGISTTTLDTLNFVVDTGGAAPISSGLKTFTYLPYSGTILSWTLLSNNTGSTQIDIWKTSYSNFPPSISDSIITSNPPTLTNQFKNQSNNLSGWTTNFVADDILGFYIVSATTLTRVQLVLTIQK